MDACATGLGAFEPLKRPSAIDSPRRCLAEASPITQRTASMMLDLPQPFGPTTAVRFTGKLAVVGSTKDLKPTSLILFSRITARACRGAASGGASMLISRNSAYPEVPVVHATALQWRRSEEHTS